MTSREERLLSIIRSSRDPAALLVIAAQAIIACQQPPAPCGSPCPADPASADETNP